MGKLFIVSTPIGNLEDITIRAIKTLLSSDIILCEDTRKTGFLLSELKKRFSNLIIRNQINKKPLLIRLDEYTEENIIPEVIYKLKKNQISLVSDAGTPLISDPGYKLVKTLKEKDIDLVCIPGSTSVISALVVSGLPPYPFCFLGYLPKKNSKAVNLLEKLKKSLNSGLRSTNIIFVSPHKFTRCLNSIKQVFGDIDIVIARELTKIHEEVWLGSISSALDNFKNPKGEIVVLFHL